MTMSHSMRACRSRPFPPSDLLELFPLAILPDLAPSTDLKQVPVDLDALRPKRLPDAFGNAREVVDGEGENRRSSSREADAEQARVS